MISTLPPTVQAYIIPAPTQLTSLQIEECAQMMLGLYHGGFQWEDLADIISVADHYLANFPTMTFDNKNSATMQILGVFVDLIDAALLPGGCTRLLFKEMVPPFAHLLLTHDAAAVVFVTGVPSSESIEDAAQNTIQTLNGGSHWEDFVSAAEFALVFSSRYQDLTGQEKADVANEFIDCAIDKADSRHGIESFSDPIFKAFIHPVVDAFFQAS